MEQETGPHGPSYPDLERRLHEVQAALGATRAELRAAHHRLLDMTAIAARRDAIEAGRRTAAVTRMSGGIAHEINNPLTVLQLRTDLLADDPSLTGPVRDQLGVLRQSVGRIARTVRALQRVGRTARVGECVAVGDLVNAAVDAVRSWFGRSPVDVAPIPPVGVRGDRAALGLAIEQLIGHAADLGHGALEVTLHDDRVWIEVRVPQPRFADGEVLEPASPDPSEGRFPGVGLTVAAGVARDHGGVLRAGRSADPGGFVRLELPVVR